MSFFTQSFFKNNRSKLLNKCPGPIIITANGLIQRSGDSTYPFKQDANFWYLTGLNQPDLILYLDQANEFLVVPSRSATRQVFDGSLDKSELSLVSGIKPI